MFHRFAELLDFRGFIAHGMSRVNRDGLNSSFLSGGGAIRNTSYLECSCRRGRTSERGGPLSPIVGPIALQGNSKNPGQDRSRSRIHAP